MAETQNVGSQDKAFLRERLRQTLAVENPADVIADMHGEQIVLGRPGRGDRVAGVALQGAGAVAIVIDPAGSTAAMQSDTVKRLKLQGRAILALDVFQTGTARAPRAREDSPPVKAANELDDSAIEHNADVATGGPKFLTFNVTDDEARVQDTLTAIAYASRSGRDVEIYANGDAAIWATFAAAVSKIPVTLHLEGEPNMATDEDYLAHFPVPGILHAGGLAVAKRLANAQ
jgi:hypothetical protein